MNKTFYLNQTDTHWTDVSILLPAFMSRDTLDFPHPFYQQIVNIALEEHDHW